MTTPPFPASVDNTYTSRPRLLQTLVIQTSKATDRKRAKQIKKTSSVKYIFQGTFYTMKINILYSR